MNAKVIGKIFGFLSFVYSCFTGAFFTKIEMAFKSAE